MFKILDGRSQFYQWDLDRKVIVEDTSVNEVHFCNRTDDCSLICEVYELDGLRVADVPNILLQEDWRINVYAYDSNYTKYADVFEVVRRSKPADYVYTETEIKNYDDLTARVEQIEKNGISDEAVANAVENYLKENEVVDLTGYATEQYVQEQIAGIEYPTTDLTGYATETYVNEKIQEAQLSGGEVEVDLSNYYTKAETDAKIENIELTPGPAGKDGKDGSDYVLTEADKKEIAGMVEVPGGGDVDLSNYYTKTEVDSAIPDVSGFQTAEQVQAAISTALGDIANAEEGAY